jgi:hypothetical protein
MNEQRFSYTSKARKPPYDKYCVGVNSDVKTHPKKMKKKQQIF